MFGVNQKVFTAPPSPSPQVTFFVAFVCFTAVLHLKYSAAAALELLMTVFMLLWYLFKLNKTLTFFFWPLVVGDA